MGTQRTSMKDVLEAINAQNDTLTALVSAIAGNAPAQAQEPTPVTETAAPVSELPQVDSKYMAHMDAKVAKLTATDGQARVMYLRRNGHGEVKIAYCLKDRWANLKDNGKLGAVKVYS